MNHHYSDIRSRIATQPKWWDENAVPRYSERAPGECANIYASEVVFLLVACQNCHRDFDVCMSRAGHERGEALREQIHHRTIHYGDPPNVACCPAGPTMNSVPMRVLEYWTRTLASGGFDWTRDAAHEVDVLPDWALDEEAVPPLNQEPTNGS